MCGFGNDSINIFDPNSPQPSNPNVPPVFHNNEKSQIKALYPVIGFRSYGDRVTFNSKSAWNYGGDFGYSSLDQCLRSDALFRAYGNKKTPFPQWFTECAFTEFNKWRTDHFTREISRAGIDTKYIGERASRENENEERSVVYCCIVASLLMGRSACCDRFCS